MLNRPLPSFRITSPSDLSVELDDFGPSADLAPEAMRSFDEGGHGDNEQDEDDNGMPLDDAIQSSTAYLIRLAGVACLGGLQFGWDTGMASGMLVAIHADLGHELSEGEQELIVSATTVGAIVGAVIAGRMADWLGRKKVMILSGVLFLLGSLEQSASQVVRELILGRVLVGLGVGMTSMVVPTYLAEVAPSRVRGRIVGINSLLVTGGQVIAYVVDAAFYNLPHGWRWMVLAGAIPAVVQLGGLFYLDESPRWLVARGRIVRARHVLQRVYPSATVRDIDNEIDRIAASMQGATTREADPDSTVTTFPSIAPLVSSATNTRSKLQLLWNQSANRKALILACGLQLFQQLVGFNSLMYFSSRLLLMAGFVDNPNAAAVGIAVANFVGTIAALRYLDTWGRRKLLLWTTIGMAVSLVLLSLSFSLIDIASTKATDSAAPTAQSHSAWPYLSLVFMVIFTLNYALGMGIVPWLIQSEVFSGEVRSVGAGLATATNWSANLLISATFLHLVKWITPSGSFAVYALVAVLSWAFTYRYLPEMKGVSLSDAHRLFQSQYEAVADSDLDTHA